MGVYNEIRIRGVIMSECCRMKEQPRSKETIKQLENRINRMVGQLNGIKNMIEEQRYCGDIIIQISAVQKALEGLSYQILQEHMHTCVPSEIDKGNIEILDEVLELIKRVK